MRSEKATYDQENEGNISFSSDENSVESSNHSANTPLISSFHVLREKYNNISGFS